MFGNSAVTFARFRGENDSIGAANSHSGGVGTGHLRYFSREKIDLLFLIGQTS
jgi:hypothetical protein